MILNKKVEAAVAQAILPSRAAAAVAQAWLCAWPSAVISGRNILTSVDSQVPKACGILRAF